jgi:acetyl-CoA acetyltransferase
MAIASGLADMVIVGGIERNRPPIAKVTDALATASDSLYAREPGSRSRAVRSVRDGVYAQVRRAPRYVHEDRDQEPRGGRLNPKAQFGQRIADMMVAKRAAAEKKGSPCRSGRTSSSSSPTTRRDPVIAWPMRLYDCSPVSDGAAALLLVAEDAAHNFTDKPLYIVGTGQGSDVPTYARETLTSLKAAKVAAAEAGARRRQATPTSSLQVHDCERGTDRCRRPGFFAPGEGWKAIADGRTRRDGSRPINCRVD